VIIQLIVFEEAGVFLSASDYAHSSACLHDYSKSLRVIGGPLYFENRLSKSTLNPYRLLWHCLGMVGRRRK